MLSKGWLFALATFILGLIVQVGFLHFVFPDFATPQLLLLATLALGGMGKTDLAQTLGFFWGLSLDVWGVSLFGTQGFLLSVMGFLSGRLSRQLNVEKWATQTALTLAGTAFFAVGLSVLDRMFRTPAASRSFFTETLLLVFVFNALSAPVLFWAMRKWVHLWAMLSGDEEIHD